MKGCICVHTYPSSRSVIKLIAALSTEPSPSEEPKEQSSEGELPSWPRLERPTRCK